MANTYTSNLKLGYPAANDTGWNVTVVADIVQLDGLSPIGGLYTSTHEQPSTSLLVDVSAGTFVKPDGTIGTYAGVSSQAITTSTTKALYLDGTASWALVVGSSYPATPHIRLATVVAGTSTITSITDNRQCFEATGSTVTADTDGATVTFDLSVGLVHSVTIAGNRTFALSNPPIGKPFTILVVQGSGGSHTVTWWSGISWGGGSPITLTTAAGKIDSVTFLCTGTGTYIDLAHTLNH